jgi:mannose-6-phosphate isomerase
VPPPSPQPPPQGHPIRLDRPLRPVAAASAQPWAGTRLGPPAGTGELWLAGPHLTVDTAAGVMTLDDVAAATGEAFLGVGPMRLLGARFPLIVKIIDAGDWLSLQVHPDDALAAELYGGRALGKAEAWLVLDGDPDARLITGPRRGLGEAALRAGIAAGALGREDCEERPAAAGETLLLAAGTLHAIGTGAFVYEIEQPSDITFRISDWGRPAVPGRGLHSAESLRAVRPDAHALPAGRDWALDGGALAVREFRLEIERPAGAVTRRPAGASLEVVTPVAGRIEVAGDGWVIALRPWETVIVPASMEAYELRGSAGAVACVGSVP